VHCSLDFQTHDCPDTSAPSFIINVVEISTGTKRPVPQAEMGAAQLDAPGKKWYEVTFTPPIYTNSLGKFTSGTFAPPVAVHWFANAGGIDQPCAFTLEFPRAPTPVDLPVVTAGSIVNGVDSTKAIWGIVYEKVGNGKRPLAGSRVSFESPRDHKVASATTKADGSFLLCNLPTDGDQLLTVAHLGYQSLTVPAKSRGVYKDYDLIISR